MISDPRKLKRWNKYSELSPVTEVNFEGEGGNSVIEIMYRPIIEKKQLSKLMLLATDVTEVRIIKQALETNEKENKRTFEVVTCLVSNDSDSLETFIQSFEQTLNNISPLAAEGLTKEVLNKTFREIHTLKGDSGSFGFNEICKILGTMEDILVKLTKQSKDSDLFKNFLNCVKQLEEGFESIGLMKEKLFSLNPSSLTIDKVQFRNLIMSIKHGSVNDKNEISQKLLDLEKKPVSVLCKRYLNLVQNYAKDKNKNIADLRIKNSNLLIHKDTFKPFEDALIHIIRNAMDHGIEENDIREANGKGVGEILLDFKETEQGFIVEVSDNGQGIDYEGLAKKAVLKGIITEKDLFLFTKDEKINLIFEPGFSSKENVTDISGRGVGMDVVKSSIEAAGGNIEIETSVGIGTTIKMYIPKNTIIHEE